MKISKSFKNQEGASAVEFIIVLPLFIVIIFGIIEFSLLLHAKAVITNASREGARLGIFYLDTKTLTEAQIVNGIKDRIADECLYNLSKSRLINLGGPPVSKIDFKNKYIDVEPVVGNIRTVTVKYPYDFLLVPSFMPGIPNTLTISATTKMKMEES